MKQRGFTLIEITAIVVILGIIFLISFPHFESFYKKSDSDKYNAFEKTLCESGREYIYENITYYDIKTPNTTFNLSINDLSINGFIDKNLVNPNTNKTIENGKLVFKVSSDLELECKFEE